MERRVLFTGRGRLVLEDLIEHIPETYQKFTCDSTESALRDALSQYHPHVVVACLAKCKESSLRMYSNLSEDSRYADVPLIALGSSDDCDVFYKHVFQKNMRIFSRPLNMDMFLDTLDLFSQMTADEEENRKKKQEEKRAKEENAKKAEEMEKAENIPAAGELKMADVVDQMHKQQERKTILVVDDDVRMLNVIKMYLQDLYDVAVVPSGKLALKFLNKKHADLVLLDYMMPEMDGPSVLQQIREDSLCPKIPVVFLTGVSEKEMVVKGLENHPSGYLLKPIQQSLLLEKITEILLGL